MPMSNACATTSSERPRGSRGSSGSELASCADCASCCGCSRSSACSRATGSTRSSGARTSSGPLRGYAGCCRSAAATKPLGVRIREALEELGPDLREVRPGAVGAAGSAVAGGRRRAREAAGPGAAVSRRPRGGCARGSLRQARRAAVRRVRPYAARRCVDRAGACGAVAGRQRPWSSRCCGRMSRA